MALFPVTDFCKFHSEKNVKTHHMMEMDDGTDLIPREQRLSNVTEGSRGESRTKGYSTASSPEQTEPNILEEMNRLYGLGSEHSIRRHRDLKPENILRFQSDTHSSFLKLFDKASIRPVTIHQETALDDEIKAFGVMKKPARFGSYLLFQQPC